MIKIILHRDPCHGGCAPRRCKVNRMLFLLLLTILSGFSGQQVFAAEEGKIIFEQKCVACHTIGEGKRIGPDLKGVTERRDLSWLKGFIQSPSSYFAGDAIAANLLKEYGIPMPDLGLKEAEVEAILAYLKSSEPQAAGTIATPSQYIPTILISALTVIVLTLMGLLAGSKKVEVRDEKQVV